MIIQTYNLDLIPSQVPLVVHCSRYDVGSRTLNFNLYNGGVLFNIPSGTTITIRGTKPDKTGFEYGCSFDGSIVSVDIQEQMTVLAGDIETELRLINDGEILGTANFILRVEKSALAEDISISETDLPLLEEAEANALRAEVAADRAEQVVTEKMNLVASPTNNDILLTDANGQAIDSGTNLTAINNSIASKQNILSAGTGIDITNNVISNKFNQINSVDLDTVDYNYLGYSNSSINMPADVNAGGEFVNITRADNTNVRIQFYAPYGSNSIYYRQMNASVWSDWAKVGTGLKSLWTNASPTSQFASQSLAIAGARHGAFLVVFRQTTTNANQVSIILNTDGTYVGLGLAGNTIAIRSTSLSAAKTSIYFSNATRHATYGSAGTQDNTAMIPIAVYGLA